MQYSRYNHICKLESDTGNYLLYNFLTGALVKLDPEHKVIFENILQNDVDKDLQSFFLSNGFITDNFDEIEYLRLGNKIVCADSNLLSVLIAPTLACNFRCPYCFEHHGNGLMDITTQNAIIEMIEKSIKEHHHKNLFVYWFGGEPLLGIDIIQSMAERLIALADQYGVTYSSAMSSNGYLLTPENMAILEKAKLGRIQITLDGMREKNDKTRKLASGEGSFDRIISNLRAMKTDIRIQIRSNLHRENADDFEQLNQLITEIAHETGVNMSAYGAHMASYEYNNEYVDDMVLNMQEFSSILKKNNLIGGSKSSGSLFSYCDAGKIFSYCFDEKGNLYKCWNDIGNPDHAYSDVFSVLKNGLNLSGKCATSFLANSFPDNEECMNCKVLPICMGGCILKRVVEKNKTCTPIRFNLDDYVNKKYKIVKGENIPDVGN